VKLAHGVNTGLLVEVEIYMSLTTIRDVVLAETETGRGILGVVDGFAPRGTEGAADIAWRKQVLRQIAYKP
jgi:adenosine/AMP kinase